MYFFNFILFLIEIPVSKEWRSWSDTALCGVWSGSVLFAYMSRLMTKQTMWLCAQRRLRSAWAFAQSDQSLRCLREESLGPQLPIDRTTKTDQTRRMPRLMWVFAGRTVILLVLSRGGSYDYVLLLIARRWIGPQAQWGSRPKSLYIIIFPGGLVLDGIWSGPLRFSWSFSLALAMLFCLALWVASRWEEGAGQSLSWPFTCVSAFVDFTFYHSFLLVPVKDSDHCFLLRIISADISMASPGHFSFGCSDYSQTRRFWLYTVVILPYRSGALFTKLFRTELIHKI